MHYIPTARPAFSIRNYTTDSIAQPPRSAKCAKPSCNFAQLKEWFFFRNPVLSPDAIASVEQKARHHGILGADESLPRFASSQGKEKIPAAWLIEHAGFPKGYACGRTGLSNKHALAIINRGGATAQDIINLMEQIQTRVLELFGIPLPPEPVFVGKIC